MTLGQKLDKLTELQRAVRSLPIGAPISRYSLTSPWGVRRDPFNNQLAMHNGLDMAAPKGTPADVLKKLDAACTAAAKEAAFADAMKKQGTIVNHLTSREYTDFLKRNDAVNRDLASELGMLKQR